MLLIAPAEIIFQRMQTAPSPNRVREPIQSWISASGRCTPMLISRSNVKPPYRGSKNFPNSKSMYFPKYSNGTKSERLTVPKQEL